MSRSAIVTLVAPLIVIVLAIPMILEKVPRNSLYGFRTPYTMSSDAVWYRANRISGIALLVAGAAWLVLGRVVQDIRLLTWLGTGGLVAAVAVSFWLVYRK